MVPFAYFLLYTIWSSTYLFIHIAVETIPPFYLTGLRNFVGGLGLVAIAAATGRFRGNLSFKGIASSVLIGSLLLIGGNGLVSVGSRTIDSHLAALIVASTPVVVAIYDRLLLKTRLSWIAALGIFFGIGGVGFLMFGDTQTGFRINMGMVFVILAVILWGLGTSLSKLLPVPKDSLANSAIQLTTVGALLLITLQTSQPVGSVDWGGISLRSWIALIYLTIMGTIGLLAFLFLLKREPNHRVVTYAFVNPLIAVLLGVMIEKETLASNVVPGGTLILCALAMMFYGERLIKRIRNSSSGTLVTDTE